MAINDNKTTVLTAILLAQTKDELMEIGEFFGVMLRQADWKAAMVLDLKCFFFNSVKRSMKGRKAVELTDYHANL